MPIWEYKVAIINVQYREAQLNAFRREGWKLFKLFPAGGRAWTAVFEREVEDKS